MEVPLTESRQQQQSELMSGKAIERHRRHIGSVAAFRGLPGSFNKFDLQAVEDK